MRQDCAGNRLGWANHRTFGAKAFLELLPEALEELDVFRFFAGKLQQCADAVVVSLELLSRMIQHERQNELFDQTEDAQVSVAPDLVEN